MERKIGAVKVTAERCFGLGKPRETWREVMLDVRVGDGEAFALPYAHLNGLKLGGENVLVLTFSSHLVRIEGDYLRPLYEALTEHAVRFVVANGTAIPTPLASASAAREPTIARIELIPLQGGGEGEII